MIGHYLISKYVNLVMVFESIFSIMHHVWLKPDFIR